MSTLRVSAYVCRGCGWSDFHPAPECPRCHGDITQSEFVGAGKIVTFTTIRYPPKGFENQAPYVVAIIDIDKGPRVIGRVSNSADDVRIGSSVSLKSSKEGKLEFQLCT
jgi:hypothetical protein